MTPQAADLSVDGPARPSGGRGLAVLLLVGGLVGFAAAFVLAVEKFRVLTNPFYVPSCSVNATVDCGSVMTSPQAEVFGFPNPLLGIAGFAVVAATGAALLAGARLAGWYWAGLQAGVTAGVVFVHWLIGQSVLVIGALCPYCMVVGRPPSRSSGTSRSATWPRSGRGCPAGPPPRSTPPPGTTPPSCSAGRPRSPRSSSSSAGPARTAR